MAKELKLRRGTTTEHSTFTGAEGEVTVDTTKDTVVVHDGSTAGGIPLAKEADIPTGALAAKDTVASADIDSDSVGADELKVTGNGTSGQALTSDGDGTMSWTTINSEVVGDTTPQLGGDLDLNSNNVTGTGNVNITGTVTATSFSGDGSALTGISAGMTSQEYGGIAFNSSSSWAVPSTVSKAKIYIIGAGGGYSSLTRSYNQSLQGPGGGGGGGTGIGYSSVTPGSQLSVSVAPAPGPNQASITTQAGSVKVNSAGGGQGSTGGAGGTVQGASYAINGTNGQNGSNQYNGEDYKPVAGNGGQSFFADFGLGWAQTLYGKKGYGGRGQSYGNNGVVVAPQANGSGFVWIEW